MGKRKSSSSSARASKQQKTSSDAADELSSINSLLQSQETSQKQTWQVGKRVKRLLETASLSADQQLDAFFLWGTALARLASLNEDPTLAAAAADKFQELTQLRQSDDEDAVDEALGPVGFSLWGSSLLIVATETRSRDALLQALQKFQKAVQVDGGTTFETRFQQAKALKEAGDFVALLEDQDGQKYYQQALSVCGELEKIFEQEKQKQKGEMEEEGDSDDEEDRVTPEDYAEVKLLEAVVQGLLEDEKSVEDFKRTVALYRLATALNTENPEALMEMTNYLAARCLTRGIMGGKLSVEEWTKLFDELEAKYKAMLSEAGFELQECHEICRRKDERDQEEPEEEEIDERVPHLLNSLGKGLAAFVRAFPDSEESQPKKKKQKQKQTTARDGARFTHAVEVLRSAHHFHDKLGGYYLACLYASPSFEDEENCRTWLETADSYGSLEDEFDVQEFTTMHDKAWFQRLTQPPEEVEVDGDDDCNDEN